MYYGKSKKQFKPLPSKVSALEIGVYTFSILIVVVNIVWAGFYGIQQLESGAQVTECKTVGEISRTLSLVGDIMAYLSIPFYVASRPGQITKIVKGKTSEGLSAGMFCLTISANLCQIVSMAVMSQEKEVLIKKIPYFFASSIPMCCDLFIVILIIKFSKKSSHTRQVKEETQVIELKRIDTNEM